MPLASQIYPTANIKMVNLTCPRNAIAFQSAYHQHSGERYRTNGSLVSKGHNSRKRDNSDKTKKKKKKKKQQKKRVSAILHGQSIYEISEP